MWVVYNPSKIKGSYRDAEKLWHSVKPGDRVWVPKRPGDWSVNLRVVEDKRKRGQAGSGRSDLKPKRDGGVGDRPEGRKAEAVAASGGVNNG